MPLYTALHSMLNAKVHVRSCKFLDMRSLKVKKHTKQWTKSGIPSIFSNFSRTAGLIETFSYRSRPI